MKLSMYGKLNFEFVEFSLITKYNLNEFFITIFFSYIGPIV